MSTPLTLRPPTAGHTVAIAGDVYRFLATGAETSGKYAMIDAWVSPGGGPPPHIHLRDEEGFLLLEGELTFWVEDQRITASAGHFVNVPAGTLHRFRNESDRPVHMLITVAPAGLEELFMAIGKPVPIGTKVAPPPSPEELQKLLEWAPRYGVQIVLPAH